MTSTVAETTDRGTLRTTAQDLSTINTTKENPLTSSPKAETTQAMEVTSPVTQELPEINETTTDPVLTRTTRKFEESPLRTTRSRSRQLIPIVPTGGPWTEVPPISKGIAIQFSPFLFLVVALITKIVS